MKTNLIKTVIILLAVTFVTLQSCEKKAIVPGDGNSELSKEKENTETVNLSSIYYDYENDMLIFATQNDLNAYINSVNLSKPISLIDKKFISLSAILNNIINSEMSLENKYENLYKDKDLSDEELKLIKNELDSKPLEKITKQYIAKGIIKIVQDGENKHFELTTCAPYYAFVLNENNMVKVGDTIYEYSVNKIKLITDGDFNKIPLLKTTNETDPKMHIDVIHVKRENKSSQYMFYYHQQIEEYEKKLIVTAFLNIYTSGSLKAYVYDEQFYCEKKNWLGRWVSDNNAEVIIKDYLQVKKAGVTVLNHSSGVVVFHNTSCYSGSVFVYNDTNNFSTAYRQFSNNGILWTRSGGPSGFSRRLWTGSYQW